MNGALIEIVCNLNQVRSPFLAAFLGLHFRECEFTSSGVNVQNNTHYDSRAAQIAMLWGFEYPIQDSKNVSTQISKKRFISVDDAVSSILTSEIDQGQLLPKILDSKFAEFMEPIDPIKCDLSGLKYELSKLLHYGVLQMSSVVSLSEISNVTAVIPKTSFRYEEIYGFLLPKLAKGNLTIIDGSLKKSSFVNKSHPEFEVREPMSSLKTGVIYSTDFEILETEKLLCSIEWKLWLFDLARRGPVVIVTPPLGADANQGICDSFLASIWSGEVWLI